MKCRQIPSKLSFISYPSFVLLSHFYYMGKWEQIQALCSVGLWCLVLSTAISCLANSVGLGEGEGTQAGMGNSFCHPSCQSSTLPIDVICHTQSLLVCSLACFKQLWHDIIHWTLSSLSLSLVDSHLHEISLSSTMLLLCHMGWYPVHSLYFANIC